MMKYYKLFDLLNRRNMKKTNLLEVVSAPTLAKLGKGDSVTTDVLCKICGFLQCQPGDIMEYAPDDTAQAPEMPQIAANATKADKSPSMADTTPPAAPKPAPEPKKRYMSFTAETEKGIDLQKLLSDFHYQLDIGETYGMDVLAGLLKKARQQPEAAAEGCDPSDLPETD